MTFLSHLDRWAELPLELRPPSGRNATSGAALAAFRSLSVSIVASRGTYPCAYTLWYAGSYFMKVSHFQGLEIEGSPFIIEVDDGATMASSSFTQGAGLVGGIAGEQLSITIQVYYYY